MTSRTDAILPRSAGSAGLRRLARRSLLGLLFAAVCVTWGTTWIAIDLAVDTVPPLMAAGLRFVIAFPLFLAFALIRRERLTFPRDQSAFFVFVLLGYFTVPYFLINWGEQFVSAGLTALLFSCMPIFMILFSTALGAASPSRNQIAGTIVGLLSLFGVLAAEGKSFGTEHWLGVVAVLAAAGLHGFTYARWKRISNPVSVITLNVLPVGAAGFALCALSLLTEAPPPAAFAARSVWALVYLGLVASLGGFIGYFYLLRFVSVAVGGYVFVIFPVVALALDHLLTGLAFHPASLALIAAMLLGFALTKIPDHALRRLLDRPGGNAA